MNEFHFFNALRLVDLTVPRGPPARRGPGPVEARGRVGLRPVREHHAELPAEDLFSSNAYFFDDVYISEFLEYV